MSRSDTEILRDRAEYRRDELRDKLTSAVMPGVDVDTLIEALEAYVDARIALASLDRIEV